MPPGSLKLRVGCVCPTKIKIRPSRFGFGVPFGLGLGLGLGLGVAGPHPSRVSLSRPTVPSSSVVPALPVMLAPSKQGPRGVHGVCFFGACRYYHVWSSSFRFFVSLCRQSLVVVSFDSFLVYRCRGE